MLVTGYRGFRRGQASSCRPESLSPVLCHLSPRPPQRPADFAQRLHREYSALMLGVYSERHGEGVADTVPANRHLLRPLLRRLQPPVRANKSASSSLFLFQPLSPVEAEKTKRTRQQWRVLCSPESKEPRASATGKPQRMARQRNANPKKSRERDAPSGGA